MDIFFRAKAVRIGTYTNLNIGDWVCGYYVKCRNHHYILQEYNDAGYDERWETEEWIEIDFNTLETYDKALQDMGAGRG